MRTSGAAAKEEAVKESGARSLRCTKRIEVVMEEVEGEREAEDRDNTRTTPRQD